MSDIFALKDWVSFLKKQPFPEGYYNRGELLEKFGQEFVTGPQTYEGRRGKVHGCFQNSANTVYGNKNLIYVEGYTTVCGIPIEHAWVVDKNNPTLVIDPTLKQPKDNAEFFGIPFKTDYVRRTSLRTGVWGIISHTNKELFKRDNNFNKIVWHAGTT